MNNKYDQVIENILVTNTGFITIAEAQAAGVSRPVFANYARRHALERVSRGVYLDPDVFPDEMALLQLRFPKAIFSHDCALYLHDLCDREPMPLTVTVPSNYNAGGLTELGVRVHYAKPEWYELGITKVTSPSGYELSTYDKERTICDLIKRRSSFDPYVFKQALIDYVRSSDKNLARLSRYASDMRIEHRVNQVIEVLL